MSLSDCIHCWDTPCTCGWEYRNWSVDALEKHVAMFNKVLFFKKQSSDAKFSKSFSDATTEDDRRFIVYMEKS